MRNPTLPTLTDLNELIKPNEMSVKLFKIDNLFEDERKSYPEEIQDMYEYDEETRTFKLLEYEWLEWRKHGPFYRDPSNKHYIKTAIGGSDIAALFDGSQLSALLYLYDGQHGSPYKAALELFYEKTGVTFDLHEPMNPDIFEIGHLEEPAIRKMFLKQYRKDHPLAIVNVYNDCHMYQCGATDSSGNLLYPFVLCDLDGLVEINGDIGILECKTCNFNSEDYPLWKQGIVPLKYYLQVCWYMACTNKPFAYICCKSGLSANDFTYIYVERNFEIENMILQMGQEFVKCVETGTEPSVSGQPLERINIIWRKKMGQVVEPAPVAILDESTSDVVLEINGINTEINVAQEKINQLKIKRQKLLIDHIYPSFGQSTYGIVKMKDGITAKIQLKNSNHTSDILNESFLRTDHPEIYKKYLSKIIKFNIPLFKKEQKKLAEKYITKSTNLSDSRANYCKITFEGKI